jgi:CDP-diacylglycerol---serine O-phosphatidyltransferase
MKTLSPVKNIPNTLTLINLVAGCLSIVSTFEGNLLLASYLILIASIFDFLDGFTARLLKAYSPLGKELDSLADLVSFGVAPAAILYHYLKVSLSFPVNEGFSTGQVILVVPFLIAAFSALRLAIFNLDTRQTSSFIGLPTPANALLIVGLVLGMNSPFANFFQGIVSSSYTLIVIIVVLSALLVSPIPMFSLKIKSLKLNESWQQFILLIIGALLIFLLGKAALLPIILFYIVFSLMLWVFSGVKG